MLTALSYVGILVAIILFTIIIFLALRTIQLI